MLALPSSEKDRAIIELLAEGYHANEVTQQLSREFPKDIISGKYVQEIERNNLRLIAQLTYSKTQELLKQVPLANKFLRVRTLDAMGEHVYDVFRMMLGEDHTDSKIMNAAAKMGDLYLKLSRLIAEETDKLPQAAASVNNYVQIIANLNPEQRARLWEVTKEGRRLLEATNNEEVIDVTLEPEFDPL